MLIPKCSKSVSI